LLVSDLESEMLGVERDCATDVGDLISDAMHAFDEPQRVSGAGALLRFRR
jgi:hypothetical protein